MLYITEENERAIDLKDKEGFEGTLQEYIKRLNELNPHLCSPVNESDPLTAYTPIYIVSFLPSVSFEQIAIARDINDYTLRERRIVREMQEQEIDPAAILAGRDLLTEMTGYNRKFREWLADPLITTPWPFWNNSITFSSTPDFFALTSISKAASLQRSPLFFGLDRLSAKLLEKYELILQIEKLKMYGNRSNAAGQIRQLERALQDIVEEIKELLNPKINKTIANHIGKRYSSEEIKKMQRMYFDKRMARKGKFVTSLFGQLNRTSLGRFRKWIPRFEGIGNIASNTGTCLGVFTVAYDTIDQGIEHGFDRSLRTAIAGSTGLAATGFITAGVYGYAIGGGTFLVATPVGWAIVAVAVGALAGYGASYVAGECYDKASDYVNKISSGKYSNCGDLLFDMFRIYGEGLVND